MPPRVASHSTICTICQRCVVRQNIKRARLDITSSPRQRHSSTSTLAPTKSSQASGYYPPPDKLAEPAFAHLKNRSLIRLQGADVVHFLNGLLPSKIHPLPKQHSSTPIFTAFLSAKGRVIYDAFVYPPSDAAPDGPWYIDVDSRSGAALFSHLKKHKLRSRFKLEKVSSDEMGIYYTWPRDDSQRSTLPVPRIGGQDPRPLMGVRFLSAPTPSQQMHEPEESTTLSALRETGRELSLEEYTIHRMITGHAEGPTELIPNSALPQESNLDFSQGIDFHKGCYLGQELTIRTHHTGVVRKRILPCQIYTPQHQDGPQQQEVPTYDPASSPSIPQPPSETNLNKVRATGRSGRSTGKWLGGTANIGLALCRLEMMTDIQLTAEGGSYDPQADSFNIVWEDSEADRDGKTTVRNVIVKPFVPSWLRSRIEAGIKARSERGQKRMMNEKRMKQEEDEDEED